jgi:hypothetical protein
MVDARGVEHLVQPPGVGGDRPAAWLVRPRWAAGGREQRQGDEEGSKAGQP